MQKIADGNDYKMPATIDDPSALTEVAKALSQLGYPKKTGRDQNAAMKRVS
jgi:propionyl-CoA synthetase